MGEHVSRPRRWRGSTSAASFRSAGRPRRFRAPVPVPPWLGRSAGGRSDDPRRGCRDGPRGRGATGGERRTRGCGRWAPQVVHRRWRSPACGGSLSRAGALGVGCGRCGRHRAAVCRFARRRLPSEAGARRRVHPAAPAQPRYPGAFAPAVRWEAAAGPRGVQGTRPARTARHPVTGRQPSDGAPSRFEAAHRSPAQWSPAAPVWRGRPRPVQILRPPAIGARRPTGVTAGRRPELARRHANAQEGGPGHGVPSVDTSGLP